MRDVVAAGPLIDAAAREARVDAGTIDRIFEGTPRDFDVIFTDRLPFRVDRLGMTGITLFGRVYLRAAARSLTPESLLLLLRHEAEHVRQQRRRGLGFYPRYLLGWLGRFAAELASRRDSGGAIRAAWHRAYRAIPAECDAYEAEARARSLLLGRRDDDAAQRQR